MPGNDTPDGAGPCPYPFALCLDREGAANAGHNDAAMKLWIDTAIKLCGGTAP